MRIVKYQDFCVILDKGERKFLYVVKTPIFLVLYLL